MTRKNRARKKGRMLPVDGGELVPVRPMAVLHGFTIVDTECVDFRGLAGPKLKRPYFHDLPLYRADTDRSDSMWRVFHRRAHAERYIKQFLKSDDYRVVPVTLRSSELKPRKGRGK